MNDDDKRAFPKLSASYDLDRDIILEDNEASKYLVVNLDLSMVEPSTKLVDTAKSLNSEIIGLDNENQPPERSEGKVNSEVKSYENLSRSLQNKNITKERSNGVSKEKTMNKKHKEVQMKDIGAYNELLDIAIALFILMIIRS